ncbi:Protein of unknown function [Pseudomonas syringae]|uniref:Uncharacterized protein n=1 Tax=Pseudomonas syringae pv. apii TaxID=81036 RepID=A0A3M3RQ56_9PSED|nr:MULTISPECIES: DUF2786 domain-containing protein [Pseudomonas syringae group]AKF53255.1 Protein of unknown function (DUF2786) [Pseudomonas syringae pv. syringae HS191]PBP73873.1 hypothetical protein CCL21_02910 [Pseudomonas syringae]RML73046.1 hypothetical protein ALQ91_200057 [Pseudomonas syringae pv. syringae]RMN49102.1 hypothetical protein ALQ58_200287 [Pseudomonas syringae pv. apii]RMN98533.1 putative uncharacterized protein pph02 [Pseudomonas syringae pv. apii]
MSIDRQRIIDKVIKCFALARSEGASPNEAETALRQGRKLMEQYQLEELEVDAHLAREASVSSGTKRAPASWLHSLAGTCASAFDCDCFAFPSRPGDWHFKFVGLGVSPDLACYAYSALHLQLVSARRQHVSQLKRCNPTTKRRRGRIFAEAWINAVASNVYKFAGRQNAETQQAISAYLSLHHPTLVEKDLEPTSVKGHDLRSQHQGWMQGSTAALHRGVDQHSPSPARIGRA